MLPRPKILLLSLVAVLSLILGWLAAALLDPARTTASQAPARQLSLDGGFSLVDETGRAVTQDSYAGKFKLVYFGFTFCPDVCPTQLEVVGRALDHLSASPDTLVPLFITLDPERDTVADMAAYTDNFHKDLVGLTGTQEQVKAAAKAYRVFFQKVEDPATTGGYTVDHSSIVFLMGPGNRYRRHFTHRDTAEQMAEKIAAELTGKPAL